MSEVEKMYENAGVKPEYRYDCNLADTIKPIEVFPLRSCSKGEIKDYCTNKQDYRYCKVYKVNKIYPPFTAEKQLELIKVIANRECFVANYVPKRNIFILSSEDYSGTQIKFSDALAELINSLWQDLTESEQEQIRSILNGN